MQALITVINTDGNPLIGMRQLNGVHPAVVTWSKGTRAELLTETFESLARLWLPDHPEAQCVALIEEDLALEPENATAIDGLIFAFSRCGLGVTAPYPAGEFGYPPWQVHHVTRGKKKVRTPFYLAPLACAVVSREQVLLLAQSRVPLPEASPEHPWAPDFEACRRLGGLMPVRLEIARPTQGRLVRCPPQALSSVPTLLDFGEPTSAELEGSPSGSPGATPTGGGTPSD
jgi:hypothetical protein